MQNNISKEKPKTEPKPRVEKYDPKVKFEGTLEDMIKIAVKLIHNKKKADDGNGAVKDKNIHILRV